MRDHAVPRAEDVLARFSLPIRVWFERALGRPTPPQAQGWEAIQRGEHTLILAPTGSGKTLAAFLWGIDQRHRELVPAQSEAGAARRRRGATARIAPARVPGVRIVYISPLKALNNDIERNLRAPLAAITQTAQELGLAFPEIRVAVRSGDTPQRERQAMARRPPDILITTPESLYILLTSPSARAMFRTTRTVIVDEIHTLTGEKRGVHLALSLERLCQIAEGPVQRIGLSATIRPLEEAARFLGGAEWESSPEPEAGQGGTIGPRLVPRPVTIVDAHYRKPLDLQVESVVESFRNLPGQSLWPPLLERVVELMAEHRTTLIFCNARRTAEQVADRLNEVLAAGEQQARASALIADGVMVGRGMMAAGDGTQPNVVRAHHGSISREARLAMERDLKEGRLPALVATSSLELGIDIGSIDLVLQIHAPEAIARGLQRAGRSGHLVGQTSKARIFPMHPEDLMAAATVAGGMLRGEAEPTKTPRNPLDVLAQQVVAMVSVESWRVEALYRLVRQAYPYQDLPESAFRLVLEMLAGRYPSQAFRELRARLSWDRVTDTLAALPGSRLLALSSGGTIPDTGSFSAYLSDGTTKLGELDEEFVFETRVGDVFMLGSQVWRVTDITDDRVQVVQAPGLIPRMPFWKGELPWRPYELGRKLGEFRRALVERLKALVAPPAQMREACEKGEAPGLRSVLDWLQTEYALDLNSAWHVIDYTATQLLAGGAISTDRTIVVEVFRDALGNPRMVVHSPFGGRVNGPWGLALAAVLRERTGTEVELRTSDDGILLGFGDRDAEVPTDVVSGTTASEARERILRDLVDSPVFGTRFRQNAARALLLPGMKGRKRTPFWLQRLRARDLLQVVRRFPDFPIMVETYRDCLQDVMDVAHLEELLEGIRSGSVQVVVREARTPSPIAQALLSRLEEDLVYEGDTPRAERQLQRLAVGRPLLQELLKDVALDDLLRPDAVEAVVQARQHTAPAARARTADELVVLLERLGDLSTAEASARSIQDAAAWLKALGEGGRIQQVAIPTAYGTEERWVPALVVPEYERAFGLPPGDAARSDEREQARLAVLQRFLANSGPVTLEAIRTRYAFPEGWLRDALDRLAESGRLARGRFVRAADSAEQYLDRANLEEIHRRTMAVLRRETRPVPRHVYADFLVRWQHAHPTERLRGRDGLIQVLQQLRALPVPGRAWEQDVLPLRVRDYDPRDLEALCDDGEIVWVGSGGNDPRRIHIQFLFRGEGNAFLEPTLPTPERLDQEAQRVFEVLRTEGALFLADLHSALRWSVPAIQRALVTLVLEGLVTNDSLASLRLLLQRAVGAPRPGEGRLRSALEAELAARRAPAGSHVLPRRGSDEYRAAKRRVAERLQGAGDLAWVGRWSLVRRLGVMGREVGPDERAARQARQLLQRWGVVTRDCLSVEGPGWDWEGICAELQRMEMRGEVRRGYFVEGLPGLQFALPEVVELLRERRDRSGEEDTPVVLVACDPANACGAEGAGDASGLSLPPRLPTVWLAQWQGRVLAVAEAGGSALMAAEGVDERVLCRAVESLSSQVLRHERRMSVQTWNGRPVLETPGAALLEAAGFYRDYRGMTREREVVP